MKQPKAPPMSPAEATSFDRYSVSNASQVITTLPCDCKPYQDVFTYRRWQGLGHQVKRGSKAIKLPQVRTVDREDKTTGEITQGKIFHMSAVFCRHQVEAK